MTNPDSIVRVRARNGGRASVYEANGWAQAYTSGFLEGSGVLQNTSADMNVLVGGSATKPDIILAENPAGYKVALDIVGQQAVAITAPASNSRISAIVAYTDDLSLATTEDTVTGSPSSCGLIVVNGTASASPSEPTDNQIRTAITSDGATGSQASYCIIATILVESSTTAITDSLITINQSKLAGTGVVTSSNIDFTTLDIITDYVPQNTSKTLNLTAGRWLVSAWCTILTSTNISDTPKLAFSLNDAEYLTTFAGNTTQQNWENLAICDLVTINPGDIFKVITEISVSGPTTRSRIIAIKLG